MNNSLTNLENDDEEELNYDHAQENLNRPRQNQLPENNGLDNPAAVGERAGRKSYRMSDRDKFRSNRKRFRGHFQQQQERQQQVMDHGGEIEPHEDDEYRSIRKRSIS